MSYRRPKAKNTFGYGIFPELDEQQAREEEETTQERTVPTPEQNRPESRWHNSIQKNSTKPSHSDFSRSRNGRRDAVDSVTTSKLGAVGKKGEPLCLAELLALERSKGLVEPENYDEAYEKLKQDGETTCLSDLQVMSVQELVAEARQQQIDGVSENSTRQELVFQIIKRRIKQNGLMFGEGTLEILPDQFGFLRSPEYNYQSCPDDIYISPSQIRRFGLRKGCTVSGQIRPPKENERYFALLRVEAINHEEPNLLNVKPFFNDLTPIHPQTKIALAGENKNRDLLIIDKLVPLGFGQRGLIVGSPGTGKTFLVRKLADAIMYNYPDIHVFVLMLDERPEEGAEMKRELKNTHCEVICSYFDDPPVRDIHVSEIVLEKAKRLVEYGKDVVILLDSMTRLARAWNADVVSASGMLNLQAPKKFFSSARKVDDGGSLTIIATMNVGTDNSLDDTIYEQFKGTGNMEMHLDAELAEKRVWPAVDILRSSTRHEEYLLKENELKESAALRRKIAEMNTEEAVEYVVEYLQIE